MPTNDMPTIEEQVRDNDTLLEVNPNLLQRGWNYIRENPRKILLAAGIAIVVTAAVIFWPVIISALTALQLAAVIVTGLAAAMVLAINGLMISKEITADPTSSKFTSSFCRMLQSFQSLFSPSTGNRPPPPAIVQPHQAATVPPPQQQPATGLPTPRPGNNPEE